MPNIDMITVQIYYSTILGRYNLASMQLYNQIITRMSNCRNLFIKIILFT